MRCFVQDFDILSFNSKTKILSNTVTEPVVLHFSKFLQHISPEIKGVSSILIVAFIHIFFFFSKELVSGYQAIKAYKTTSLLSGSRHTCTRQHCYYQVLPNLTDKLQNNPWLESEFERTPSFRATVVLI